MALIARVRSSHLATRLYAWATAQSTRWARTDGGMGTNVAGMGWFIGAGILIVALILGVTILRPWIASQFTNVTSLQMPSMPAT